MQHCGCRWNKSKFEPVMSMNVSLTAIEEKLSYFMKKFKIIISFVFFDKVTVLPTTREVLKKYLVSKRSEHIRSSLDSFYLRHGSNVFTQYLTMTSFLFIS